MMKLCMVIMVLVGCEWRLIVRAARARARRREL